MPFRHVKNYILVVQHTNSLPLLNYSFRIKYCLSIAWLCVCTLLSVIFTSVVMGYGLTLLFLLLLVCLIYETFNYGHTLMSVDYLVLQL